MSVDVRISVRTLWDMTHRSLVAAALSLVLVGCAGAVSTEELRGRRFDSPALPADCRTSMPTTVAGAMRCSEGIVEFTTTRVLRVTVTIATANCDLAVAGYESLYELRGDVVTPTAPFQCTPASTPFRCSTSTERDGAACAVLQALALRFTRSAQDGLQLRDATGREWIAASR